MRTILLSINPEHVENIFNGTKRYEFRKTQCKEPIDKIIIYSTCPTKKVVGEAKVSETLVETPDTIWNKTKKESGIGKEFFDDYYRGHDKAVAYHLDDVVKYDDAKNLSEYGLNSAPQSFAYIDWM